MEKTNMLIGKAAIITMLIGKRLQTLGMNENEISEYKEAMKSDIKRNCEAKEIWLSHLEEDGNLNIITSFDPPKLRENSFLIWTNN